MHAKLFQYLTVCNFHFTPISTTLPVKGKSNWVPQFCFEVSLKLGSALREELCVGSDIHICVYTYVYIMWCWCQVRDIPVANDIFGVCYLLFFAFFMGEYWNICTQFIYGVKAGKCHRKCHKIDLKYFINKQCLFRKIYYFCHVEMSIKYKSK